MSKPPIIIPPRPGLKKITSLFGKPNETIKTLMEEFNKNQIEAPGKIIEIKVPSDFDAIKNQIIVECNSYLDRVSKGYDSKNTYIELLSPKIFDNAFIEKLGKMLITCKDNIVTQLQKQQPKENTKCKTGLKNMDVIDFKQPTSLDDPILSEYNQVVALCTANFVINLHDEIFDFFGAFVTATPQNPDCFMYHILQYRNAYVQLMNIWSLTPLERINEGTQITILNYMINPKYNYFFLNTNVLKPGVIIKNKITKILEKKLTKPINASIPTFIKQVKERNIDLFDLFDVMNDVQKFNVEKQTIRYDYLNALIAQLKIEQNKENAKALYTSWFDCFHINEYNNVDKKQLKIFEHKTKDTNAFMAFWNTDEYTNQIQLLDAYIKELEPQYVIHDRYPLKGNTTSRSNTNKRVPLNVVVKKEGIVEKKEGIVKWPNLSGYP